MFIQGELYHETVVKLFEYILHLGAALGGAHSRVREDVGDLTGYADFPVGIFPLFQPQF